VSVPRGSRFAAQPAGGGDQIVFETERALELIRPPLTHVLVFDGSGLQEVTIDNNTRGVSFPPFGWAPQAGSALYLGFDAAAPLPTGRLPFPQEMRFRVFLPQSARGRWAQSCAEAGMPSEPPVKVAWECRPKAGSALWRRLDVPEDGSAAFTREGTISVQGPAGEVEAFKIGQVQDNCYWLRCRLEETYPKGQEPLIDFIRSNTVDAVSLTTEREEILGTSDGRPNQIFQVQRRPVQPASLIVRVEAEGEPEQTWKWAQVDDLSGSGPDKQHYVLEPTTGQIRFGDGRRGSIPLAGATIVAQEYRYGGGEAANVGPDQINAPLTFIEGVQAVTNERPAVGGSEEQTLEDLKDEAPGVLRSRDRAITVKDFTALAERLGGVARAQAIPLMHPAFPYPDVKVPGAVTVVIIPDTQDPAPQPSQDLITEVCHYVNDYRLLTTELFVKGPEYIKIAVEARVEAQPYAAPDDVARNVEKALNDYLDPLGRVAGWSGLSLGQDLRPVNFYRVIQSVPDVVDVPQLTVFVDGQPHPLEKPVHVPADGLVYGVEHRITVVPYRDQ
jgi:hypothetical protein